MPAFFSSFLAPLMFAASSLGDAASEPDAPDATATATATVIEQRGPEVAFVPSASAVDSRPSPSPTAAPRFDSFRAGASLRFNQVDGAGFDAFADSDLLAQLSLDATYAFYTHGKLAVASGVAWDFGERS